MIKSARTRERIFTVTMWIVSVILAGFLIGVGGLVIGDLPRVANPVSIEQFIDRSAAQRIEAERGALTRRLAEIASRLSAADQRYADANNDAQSAQAAFDAWVAARVATTDPAQDAEVLSRTRALEALRQTERTALQARDDVYAEQVAGQQEFAANAEKMRALEEAAFPQYERARFFQDLNVFALRLAFTLPLLLIAAFFMLQKQKGDYWPLQRGFVLFALFAFFVELVPYLPEYGGYVRYGVGILITVLVGHFVIRWMRTYLKTRAEAEAKAETDRKKSIAYEDALKKMAAKACPGCDRPLAASEDAAVDFCMHCGMQLYDHCGACSTRKSAFFRYCMKCGAAAQAQAATA